MSKSIRELVNQGPLSASDLVVSSNPSTDQAFKRTVSESANDFGLDVTQQGELSTTVPFVNVATSQQSISGTFENYPAIPMSVECTDFNDYDSIRIGAKVNFTVSPWNGFVVYKEIVTSPPPSKYILYMRIPIALTGVSGGGYTNPSYIRLKSNGHVAQSFGEFGYFDNMTISACKYIDTRYNDQLTPLVEYDLITAGFNTDFEQGGFEVAGYSYEVGTGLKIPSCGMYRLHATLTMGSDEAQTVSGAGWQLRVYRNGGIDSGMSRDEQRPLMKADWGVLVYTDGIYRLAQEEILNFKFYHTYPNTQNHIFVNPSTILYPTTGVELYKIA